MDINPAEGVSRKLNIDFKQGGVLNTSPCFLNNYQKYTIISYKKISIKIFKIIAKTIEKL